jgi:hypothetical protein
MAYYDHQPSVFEAVGNGSTRYRFNIQEVEVENNQTSGEEPQQGEGETQTQWQCDEVIVFAPLSANKFTQAVISHKWDSDYEQKLINEFNAANLGLIDGSKTSDAAKAKIQAYKDFLTERAALKSQVDADCAEHGIL